MTCLCTVERVGVGQSRSVAPAAIRICCQQALGQLDGPHACMEMEQPHRIARIAGAELGETQHDAGAIVWRRGAACVASGIVLRTRDGRRFLENQRSD